MLALLLLVSWPGGVSAAPRKLTVVTWTDIHYGNERYVPAAWKEAYEEGLALHPDVVMMTGDQMDNKCSREEFLRRQEVFLTDLRKRLDRVRAPIMLVFGNNDFYANYQTDPEVMKPTMEAYARHLGRLDYLDELGNGVFPRPVGGMTWITINSQIFSPLNHYHGAPEQAEKTLGWLAARLAALPQGRNVVILMHIPPSFDLYDGKLSWESRQVERLRRILAGCKGRVVLLGAHYHRNEIHGFEIPGKGMAPLLVAGSVSFKYGNHPNWRSTAWTLARDGTVERFDWINHYPGQPTWRATWKLIRPFAPATYGAFASLLGQSLPEYLRYMEDLDAHNASWRKWADDPRTRPALIDQIVTRVLEPHR
jgi:hypothetical protein